MFRNLLSIYWPSIPSHGMDVHVLFEWPNPLWTTSDMLGHPYFMFVVHIPFIFWRMSWTSIMDEDYLLFITISCPFVYCSSMLSSYLPCVCVCVFLFIYLLFFMWHILINCWVMLMVSNDLMKSIGVGVATWLDHSG